MQYATTPFGPIPLPDEHIPRCDWGGYLRAAKNAAQIAWENDQPYSPIDLATAQLDPEFQPPRSITSDGWVTG